MSKYKTADGKWEDFVIQTDLRDPEVDERINGLQERIEYLEENGTGGGGSGTTDHTQLTNRDAADQHPISSIIGLQTALNGITGNIVNTIYPVGGVYISANATSPAALFGGTWEQIKDTFLLSAGDTYTAGATGGEAAHTHTLDSAAAYVDSNAGTLCWKHKVIGDWNATWQFTGSGSGYSSAVRNSGISLHGTTDTTSNLPPYLAVYMWKRVA